MRRASISPAASPPRAPRAVSNPTPSISVKQAIDAGQIPGPKLFLTGPYLEGAPSIGPQLHALTGPDDAARLVGYWSAEGMTSFKAYMHITPEELKAAVDHAHEHGLKITGHLCAVGFKEAAGLGIDDLEHGLAVDTELFAKKDRRLPRPASTPG